jgi:hypothetical protein
METVYLQGGEFNGEDRELNETDVVYDFAPGHVHYKDSSERNQAGQHIFVYEPRDRDVDVSLEVKVSG